MKNYAITTEKPSGITGHDESLIKLFAEGLAADQRASANINGTKYTAHATQIDSTSGEYYIQTVVKKNGKGFAINLYSERTKDKVFWIVGEKQ